MLDEARALLDRLEPRAALDAVEHGALIVDIRSDTNRHRDGIIPGSLHLPRTVLEWRVDPDSPWRNPHVGGLDRHLILVCDHGYCSSLAAATLVQLGFARATDLSAASSPGATQGCRPHRAGGRCSSPVAPAGMGPPDP